MDIYWLLWLSLNIFFCFILLFAKPGVLIPRVLDQMRTQLTNQGGLQLPGIFLKTPDPVHLYTLKHYINRTHMVSVKKTDENLYCLAHIVLVSVLFCLSKSCWVVLLCPFLDAKVHFNGQLKQLIMAVYKAFVCKRQSCLISFFFWHYFFCSFIHFFILYCAVVLL
jgi:hypothetical protein